MRAWRKLYATILDSDQISELSDGATVLLCLLIVAQDDTGYWPWTPAKVRHLIACRPQWTHKRVTGYAEELVAGSVATWTDGGIVLVKGEALNGRYRADIPSIVYPRSPLRSVDGADTVRILNVSTEEIRGEEIREDKREIRERGDKRRATLEARSEKQENLKRKPARGPSINSSITPEFLSEMVTEFTTLKVDSELKRCKLWWQERKKKEPSKLAFRNWLEKAVKILAEEKERELNGKDTRVPESEPDPRWTVIRSGPE